RVLMFTFTLHFYLNASEYTVITTLSLHDALPICRACAGRQKGLFRQLAAGGGCAGFVAVVVRVVSGYAVARRADADLGLAPAVSDRKSTRLNSSHVSISYAVFCLKKKRSIETR